MNLTTFLLGIIAVEVTYLVYRSRPQLRSKSRGGVFVDTSALMDGRIVTAAQTGFVPEHIVVPRSVINELQLLADQADPEKRSRARRGLDAVQELQAMEHLRVETIDDGKPGSGGVDERLIDLAKRHNGTICTIDFNLNKAATALGIRVLNINELAGNIRMAFLPGETISLALTQKGQSSSQAVGYLADGTMVVVDKAAGKIGQTIEIEFIRSLQTAAGRMMFARPLAKSKPAQTRGEEESEDHVIATKTEQTRDKNADDQKSMDKPRSNRQNGRAKTSRTQPVANTAEADKAEKPSSQRPRRSNNRRKNHEDSLIELVNRQD